MSFGRSVPSILWGALFAGLATFASVCVSGFCYLWYYTRQAKEELAEAVHSDLYDRVREHQRLLPEPAAVTSPGEAPPVAVIDMRTRS